MKKAKGATHKLLSIAKLVTQGFLRLLHGVIDQALVTAH